MKYNYAILIFTIVCLVSFNSTAQSVSIPEAKLSVSPLGTIENNGSAIASFNLVESSGVDVRSFANNTPNVKITVNLNYLELTNEDISQISGSVMEYFTVSYDSAIDVLRFEQINDIPGDWYGDVSFPVTVTQNSTKEESLNGIYANVYSMNNKVNAFGNASVFTNTAASVLAIADNEVRELPFEVLPNPTEGPFTIFLKSNDDAKVEIFDLLGKEIFTKTFTGMDQIDLNIDYLASAVYVLKVTSNGASKNVQIIRR